MSNTAATSPAWDYLIVTASNELQARAYTTQLSLRQQLGLLPTIGTALVVADPGGKRVGSGGSTLFCLIEVLQREAKRYGVNLGDWTGVERLLKAVRVLIIHAGGDSRRLPAYGPCGKIFVPVPGESKSALGLSLFDRQLPIFAALPDHGAGDGQVVVTSGDALIQFDASEVRLAPSGITALGDYATPEAASKHGVFCVEPDGATRLYLQKPKPEEQVRLGAINNAGKSVLDIGVMSFDGSTAAALLKAFEVQADAAGHLAFSPRMEQAVMNQGLDIYREVLCALGRDATVAHHRSQAKSAGSAWAPELLAAMFSILNRMPLRTQVLSRCSFLHFGTTRQLIQSGHTLVRQDLGTLPADGQLLLNNAREERGGVTGKNCWVEGCRLDALLTLAGDNVVVGIDVVAPLQLQPGQCLDVVEGFSRSQQPGFFIRPHGIGDTFKDPAVAKGTFCGQPILEWLAAVGAEPADIWEAAIPADKYSLWDARVFPVVREATGYRDWLWMFNPAQATPEQKRAFLAADRYSSAEIALQANQDAFYERRAQLRRA
ncbi:MAG: L-fucokinase [Verrucomicrobiota bacterium]